MKEERRQKSQGKNIMVCPITQGDHKKQITIPTMHRHPLDFG